MEFCCGWSSWPWDRGVEYALVRGSCLLRLREKRCPQPGCAHRACWHEGSFRRNPGAGGGSGGNEGGAEKDCRAQILSRLRPGSDGDGRRYLVFCVVFVFGFWFCWWFGVFVGVF